MIHKKKHKRVLLKIGDIFEIPLADGRKAYSQYIFYDKNSLGPLIQVLNLIIDQKENASLEKIKKAKALFPPVFTGLFAAVRIGLWKVTYNLPIKNFVYPKFITGLPDKNGKILMWFFIDSNNKTIKIGKTLPEKYKKLEIKVGWDPRVLAKRIETGINPLVRWWID